MFADFRLKMLKTYVKEDNIVPTFDNNILNNSSFIFIRKEKIKFFDRIIKYNILHNIKNNLTLYIPCAICNGNELDNCYNSTITYYKILNDMIFDNCNNGNISLNHKFEDKQHIIMEYNNNDIEKIAKNMFAKIKAKEEYNKKLKEQQMSLEEKRYKSKEDEFLKIRNKLSNELNSILKKYHIEISGSYGEYGIIYKGEHLFDESFMSLF